MKKLISEKFFSSRISKIEDQVMVGSKCKNCGKIYFPKKRVCPSCLKIDEMEEVPLSKRGKLYSYTIAGVGPVGFKPPYAFGWVDLPEGVRVYSLLTQCEPFDEKLKLGIDVEMVMEKITQDYEGNEGYGYKFRPVGD
jgi:uncharacterized OB-fold protein